MTLEKLLSILCAKGWKPRGKNYGVIDFLGTLVFVDLNDGRLQSKNALNLRKLTSKESGLWQFVCENGMIREGNVKNFVWTRYEHTGFEPQYPLVHKWNYAEYRLIESSLRDESELEEFLLDNIKIEGK